MYNENSTPRTERYGVYSFKEKCMKKNAIIGVRTARMPQSEHAKCVRTTHNKVFA